MGIVWDQNTAIDIGRWSICGGDQLERFYCILFKQVKFVPVNCDKIYMLMLIPSGSFRMIMQGLCRCIVALCILREWHRLQNCSYGSGTTQ